MHLLPSLALLDLRETNCTPGPVREQLQKGIDSLPIASRAHFHLAQTKRDLALISTTSSLTGTLRRLVHPLLPPTILINQLSRKETLLTAKQAAKPRNVNSAYTAIHGRVSGTTRISAAILEEDAAIEANKGAAFRTGRGESTAAGQTTEWKSTQTHLLKSDEMRLASVESEEEEEEEEEEVQGQDVGAGRFHGLPTFKKSKERSQNELGCAIFVRTVPSSALGFQPGQMVAKKEEVQKPQVLAKPKVFGRPVAEPVKTRPKTSLKQSASAASLLDFIAQPAPAKKARLSDSAPSSSSSFGSFGSQSSRPSSSLASRKTMSAFRRK